ncbi:ABC transporter permease, partial [Candidatus Bipolaricaulota bacterium]|nr:ABC transporter permease [Candidatus Bipolaricaulota bacterium]
MRFIHVAIKGFKEIVRDRKGLAMLLAFPAIFMLVFGFAFSGGQGENSPYQLGVVNRDRGASVELPGSEGGTTVFGDQLVKTLEDLTFEKSDTPLFEIRNVNREEGKSLLQDRELAVLLTIPAEFSETVNQLIKATVRREVTSQVGELVIEEVSRISSDSKGNPSSSDFELSEFDDKFAGGRWRKLPDVEDLSANLVITGDPGYIAYGRARGMLTGVLERYQEEITARARKEVASEFEVGESSIREFVGITSESISGSQSLSIFDYQAPGILVFAVLIAAIGVATTLAGEVESGTLERLKLTNMSAFDLLFGTLIPWSFMAMVQVLILFATALLIGFSWAGGFSSLLLAIVVAAIGGVASVALGLLIAAFADGEDHASNLGTLVTVPLSFISGAFFPLPSLVLGNFFGYKFELYDILPWSHASQALRVLLSFGGGIGEVLPDIIFMLVLTILLFFVGVIV